MPTATAPSPTAAFVAELEQESAATRKLFDRLPADKLAWKPHPKSHTLGQLAIHLAGIPGLVTGLLAVDTFDGTNADFTPPQPKNVAEIRQKYEEALAGAKKLLATWGERDLATTWRFLRSGKEKMAAPKGALLRMLVLSHFIHHRGQLTVYLRLLDVTLPSIYGPSADENPFA